jgi:hypothetical protein
MPFDPTCNPEPNDVILHGLEIPANMVIDNALLFTVADNHSQPRPPTQFVENRDSVSGQRRLANRNSNWQPNVHNKNLAHAQALANVLGRNG